MICFPADIHPELLALVRRHCLDPLGYRALIAEEAFTLGRKVGRAEAAPEAQTEKRLRIWMSSEENLLRAKDAFPVEAQEAHKAGERG